MKIIKTKKFTLRTISISDAKDLAKNMNNWNVIKNLSQLPFPYELKDAKAFCSRIEKEMAQEDPKNFVMVIEIDGAVVGAIGAHHIVYSHKAEVGYWLAEKHWGKSIMTEALKKFTAHIFSEFKLRRIYSEIYTHNVGSKKWQKKLACNWRVSSVKVP